MDDIVAIENWFEGTGYPVIIAGPCSAESEEQVVDTARALASDGRCHIFRAGVWKPRSRPSSFSGMGSEALGWLARVKEETGMIVAIEAGTPGHVEEAIESGVADIFWIGSRTVSNPFSVDEIAEALRGTGRAVMVKNPLTPDIDLWSGAIERVYGAGISRLAAVHRGFSPFGRSRYRNMAKWEVPLGIRDRFPHISIISDPSHLAGEASLVPEVAERALKIGMDGFMVEVHHDPDRALSDRRQQLTPVAFSSLMDRLMAGWSGVSGRSPYDMLQGLRDQVDSIDYQLIELISARMEIAARMGEYKRRHNISIVQIERWLDIARSRVAHGRSAGLDIPFTEAFMKLLHHESVKIQASVDSDHNPERDHPQ